MIKAAVVFLLALPLSALAVSEVAPSPVNRGNWNREEVIDYLERSWEQQDLGAMYDWFDAKDTWKAIWVKNLYFRHEDSPFKRRVTVLMLKSTSDAWGDPDPSGLMPADPQPPTERPSTIQGCTEEIHAAAPELGVTPADFETHDRRLALAERFSQSIGLVNAAPPVAEEEESTPAADTPPASPALKAAGLHALPRRGLLIGAGLLLVGGYFLRSARLKRRELRDTP